MKVLLRKNSVVLVGRAWEIREKLKEYAKKYDSIQEWIFAQQKKQ